MDIIFYIFVSVLILIHFLPMIRHQHWVFRTSDFGRIQVFVIQLIVIFFGLVFIQDKGTVFWLFEVILALLVFQNAWILFPYTPFYRTQKVDVVAQHSANVTILSSNVYQFNNEYDRLIGLIDKTDPDIILTMETNKDWEEALSVIEKDYPHFKKIPLENCYGMHFYTRMEVLEIQVHFFVTDDLPSIEASLCTEDGYEFTFFGVHPPPPSPTEEETSKERDGDLMAIAKRIKGIAQPVIAVGDFNNVAWARASKLFRKMSGLIDPRKGRGFISTFHVRYPIFRFPIDLVFHSKEIFIKDLETKEDVGSDHFPVLCRFFINLHVNNQENEEGELDEGEEEEVEELIEAGKEEEGDR